jgi:hypothetical protein
LRGEWRMFLIADFGRVNAHVFCNPWTFRGSRQRRWRLRWSGRREEWCRGLFGEGWVLVGLISLELR